MQPRIRECESSIRLFVKIFEDGLAGDNMKQIPENKAREKRIADEVTVNANGSEEIMVGWLAGLFTRQFAISF